VLEAFDIPRLVRRADGNERRPRCGADLSEVSTPLTREECLVVAVARFVQGNRHARVHQARIESAINERLMQARYDAFLHDHDVRVDFVFPPFKIPLRFHLDRDTEASCNSCPETRPDFDEEAAE
jgi:hypothetical protein